MPYPERPYQVRAIATYRGGIECELVEYGDPCTEEVNHFTEARRTCKKTPTYLQGGTPRCVKHLAKLCKHGQYSHALCGTYSGPISVRRLRKPRPQSSSS